MDVLRISAKDLGALKLDGFCPRCFWIERHMKLPYQSPFPGIFSSIDSYTKKMVRLHLERTGKLPAWLTGIGRISGTVDKPDAFFAERNGVRLTGSPDEMFRTTKGELIIVDYKTARYTGNQDALMPMYEVQLNGYAYIAEKTGLGSSSGLHLVYFEPPDEGFEELERKYVDSEGFGMPFKPTLHRIAKDTKGIEALMDKARLIYGSAKPPNGVEGCEDCRRLDELAKESKNWMGLV